MLVWSKRLNFAAGAPQIEARELSTGMELTAPSTAAATLMRPWPRLLPVDDAESTAALIVPPHWHRLVERNGVPLSSGVHALQHADRVDLATETYWVAATRRVEAAAYDPARHGEDMFCLLTKTRLQAGNAIVACPGRPGIPCCAIYRESAWQMALESNRRFVCLRCGFDPSAPEWEPTLPPDSPLPQLLELADRRRQEAAS